MKAIPSTTMEYLLVRVLLQLNSLRNINNYNNNQGRDGDLPLKKKKLSSNNIDQSGRYQLSKRQEKHYRNVERIYVKLAQYNLNANISK